MEHALLITYLNVDASATLAELNWRSVMKKGCLCKTLWPSFI